MSLHLFTTAEQREQMLKQEARTHVVVHAQNYMLLSRFLELCLPPGKKRLCAPQEQVLVAWEIIRRHPRESRESESDFHMAQLFVEQLKGIRQQGCSLEDWRQVSFKLKEHTPLLWFADVWEEYASRLSALFLMDDVDVLCAAIDALDKGHIPEQLRGVSQVFFHELSHITPLEQRFFFALDRVLSSVGGALFLETFGVDNPELDGLVDELHGEFERTEEGLNSNLQLLRNVLSPSSPAFELCKHLFGETHSEAAELPWDCFVAPNAFREVREATKRVAHLLKLGVAPESIAVVLCSDAHWAHAVWHELASHSIPAHIQEEVPLSSCACGSAILRWPKWIEEGFPVEQAHVFFSNPLFEKTFVRHDDVGIFLQRAGMDCHSKQECLDDYVARLSLLKESEQLKGVFFETLQKKVEIAKSAAEHLPEEGSFKEMMEGWWASLQKLGFNPNAFMQGQFQPGGSLEFCPPQNASPHALEMQIQRRMLARENAAGAFLKQTLSDWRGRLQKTKTDVQRLTRKAFSEWLLATVGNETIRIREPKTAGVTVAHFKAMRAQKYKHVFFLGMEEGAFSQKKRGAFIPEALQSLVNANSARCFFKTQRGESLHKLPEEIVTERRNFAQAVVCATKKLCFSYSLAEHSKRERLPSLYWQEALRISKKGVPTFAQRSRFSPQLSECMTESDFRGHVAQKIRQHFYERRPKALSFETPLMQESWLLNLLEKSEAERERFYFQRDRTRKPGAYTGHVLSLKTEKYLKAFAKLPWSAYAFGRLGGCAFGFFMAHLLKGEVFEDGGVDVGAKTKGVLFHRALALLGGDLVSLSKTKGDFDEEQQKKRVSEAVEAAQKAAEADARLAHPELWRLCCEQVEAELFGFLNSKSLFPFGAPLKVLTEWSFEEEAEVGGAQETDFEAEEGSAFEKRVLQLKGRVDRFDVLDDGSVGVMDYKLGKRGSKNKYRESLLVDDFQLLLYLFALRRRGFQAKRASWVFLREKAHFLLEEWITPEMLDEILEEDLATRLSLKKRGKLNLLNRMEALVSKVERGDFSPVPVDCGYCPFKRACRVSEKTTLQTESP